MIYPMSEDPAWDAERWEHEKDREGRLWAKVRPFCVVCDERISDAYCYVMDEDDPEGSCICEDCMKGQLDKLVKANVNVMLREWIAEEIEYVSGCRQSTPYLRREF